MNPLQLRLAALRRRLRLVVTFRGVCWLLTITLATAALAGLLDWRVHLPSLVRALILVTALAGSGYVGYRCLLRPLWSRLDDLTLALRIEALYPSLNDNLASAVQFLQESVDSERSGSPAMRRVAEQQGLRKAKDCDFNKVVSKRGLPSAGMSMLGAVFLAVGFAILQPAAAWTALVRLADPYGKHDWPLQTQLEITGGQDRIARGEPYEIHATVSGIIPENAVIEYKGLPSARQTYPIVKGKLAVRLDRVEQPFRFQVQANDAHSEWYSVAVLPPPMLVPLQDRPSPQVRLTYPAYTDLPMQDLPDGSGDIEAVAGTRVSWRAACDRPLARAWIEYRPDQPLLRQSAFCMGLLGANCPAAALTLLAAVQDIGDRIPVRLEGNGQVLEADFAPPWISGTYAVRFADEKGLSSTRLFNLHIQRDPAPIVNLERPSRSQDSLDLLPGAEVHVQVATEDREYALRSVYLEYRSGKDEPARQLPLYDHQSVGAAVPRLLAGMTWSPLPGATTPAPGLRLRPQELHPALVLSLDQIKHPDQTDLQEGDVVVLQACANDFDDVSANKQPGRSHEVELHIVARSALENSLNQAQTQVQQELLRIRKLQQEALEHVIGPEQRWRNTGKLEAHDLDQLRQAEQLQQQVRARVGNPQEGLRAEVARIQETLRANHLPRSGTHERMETVAGELERVAREDLEQIEPALTNARKENEVPGDHPKPAPKTPGPLGQARQHQEEVDNTINNLLKLLEPWGSVNEVKGEAKAILQEGRKLEGQTADLNNQESIGRQRDELTPEKKAALDRIAELQNKLGERAGQLLDKMDRVRQDTEKTPEETARALEEAAKTGRSADIPGEMKKARDEVRNNHLNDAGEAQRKSLLGLEQVVKALEDQREKELQGLRKKLKDAQEQLADLAREQDELRKKAAEAAQVTDPAERERQLKELARRQEELRKQSQEMVKELTRLRADQASQALNNAGGSMEQAGQKMAQGQDAQDPHEETLDRLNEAQRRLQQAQKDLEGELGREKLAKIADQLKLLKERQEKALAESDRLQKEALQHTEWTRALQASLRNLSDVQTGLSEETRNLMKERLAGARVFARLLNRSADSMAQASEQILKHLEQVKDRPDDTADDSETRRLQEDALRRLGQVIDAIKPENNLARASSSGGGGGGEGGAGGPAGAGDDGIPPLAQLKVLHAMQKDILDRTETFDRKHPDPEKLTAGDKRQLKALGEDQQEVGTLLEELTHPTDEEGDKP